MLIDNSYFNVPEKNIPNTNYADVSDLIIDMIKLYEPVYLERALGYELYKNFIASLLLSSPAQIYLDILFGKEFTGLDGIKKKWKGLVSLTSSSPSVQVNPSSDEDIFFTVGQPGSPVHGDPSYINTELAGKNVRITQRAYGPLEQLKDDNSNVLTADIQIRPTGGFDWLNGIKFSNNDKYQVEKLMNTLDVSSYALVPLPQSPIADYVFYYWLKENATNTASVGENKTDAENSTPASPRFKMVRSWNNMVKKTLLLHEFLLVNISSYPEYEKHVCTKDKMRLLTKITAYGI